MFSTTKCDSICGFDINWSRIRYLQFQELQEDGDLFPISYGGLDEDEEARHDQTFNAFNMNLTYSWQIAPGSSVTTVWREGLQ